MNKILNVFTLLEIILLIVLPTLLNAQPFDDDVLDNPIPFDGGVTVLIVIGIIYGAKKTHDRKKAEKW